MFKNLNKHERQNQSQNYSWRQFCSSIICNHMVHDNYVCVDADIIIMKTTVTVGIALEN